MLSRLQGRCQERLAGAVRERNHPARGLGQSLLKLRDQWLVFKRGKHSPRLYNAAGLCRSAEMTIGLTTLAVLTIIAINEIGRTQRQTFKGKKGD